MQSLNNFHAEYRSKADLWCGFAARARVLLVNTDLVPHEAMPTSIEDLCDPQWKDRVGIAKPLGWYHSQPRGLPVRGLGRRARQGILSVG